MIFFLIEKNLYYLIIVLILDSWEIEANLLIRYIVMNNIITHKYYRYTDITIHNYYSMNRLWILLISYITNIACI